MDVKKADKLHCPMLDKPCIRDECMFWTSYVRQKNAEEQEVVFNCAISFLPVLLGQTVLEQIITQNTVQHQTNQLFATFKAMQNRQPIPNLSGNFAEDQKVLEEMEDHDG